MNPRSNYDCGGRATHARRVAQADQAYQWAIGLEPDPAVRRFLQQRRTQLRERAGEPPPSK